MYDLYFTCNFSLGLLFRCTLNGFLKFSFSVYASFKHIILNLKSFIGFLCNESPVLLVFVMFWVVVLTHDPFFPPFFFLHFKDNTDIKCYFMNLILFTVLYLHLFISFWCSSYSPHLIIQFHAVISIILLTPSLSLSSSATQPGVSQSSASSKRRGNIRLLFFSFLKCSFSFGVVLWWFGFSIFSSTFYFSWPCRDNCAYNRRCIALVSW